MLIAAVNVGPLVITSQGSSLVGTCGDATAFDPGLILLRVAPGQDINAIVVDHGGSVLDVEAVFLGPFDEISRTNGMDRFFQLTVPVGHEEETVEEYARDGRIEYVQLENNKGVCELSRRGPRV